MFISETTLTAFLLPVAAATGWWLGYARVKKVREKQSAALSKDYFVGLNYLLNEEQDKALDVFMRMLEVDSETVEMHLTLGNLFRRRGEVDRAIRIHQNLIARPHLTKRERIQSLSELAQDYLKAGVFDRAERLFLEVIETGEYTQDSLRFLMDIYQQEKDWERAILMAEKLQSLSSKNMAPVIAHYYCQMAAHANFQHQYENAQRLLKKALSIDKKCVRASLMQADMEIAAGNDKAAIRAYKRVKTQDPDFLSEVIPAMVECYERIDAEQELIDYLKQCLAAYPRISIVLMLSERIRKLNGDKAAADFIAEQLKLNPSIRGIHRLIELHLAYTESTAKDDMIILKDLTEKLLENKPTYRCGHCGFSGKTLHWQCPSCKYWNTVKPIHGLEGD